MISGVARAAAVPHGEAVRPDRPDRPAHGAEDAVPAAGQAEVFNNKQK